MSIQYNWIEDIDRFREISADWDKAAGRSGSYNPFLLSDFIMTWAKHFAGRYPLRILVVLEGTTITGGIPLCLKKGPGPYSFARIFSYAGGTAANYTEPLYADKTLRLLPVIVEALSKRRDWDVLSLSDIRHDNRLISEAASDPVGVDLSLKLRSDHSNWAIDLSEGVERYLSSLSPKMKRDLKVKRKHLEGRFGPLSLQQISGADKVGKTFDLYRGYSLSAFAERGRESSFEDKQYASFFREFLGVMEDKKKLDAHILYAADEPLAVSFGYRFGPGFNWVLTAFNYEHRYYRPGYLLIEEIIKLIAARRETFYNWYGYERFYKSQWCNSQTPLYRLIMVRRSLKGGVYKMLSSAENMFRSNKIIVSAARRLRRS